RDADGYMSLLVEQRKAKENRDRKRRGEKVSAGERISAEDYTEEPDYPHPGIHLKGNQGDEIVWLSNQRINFLIDVGPEPELVRLEQDLPGNGHLVSRAELHQEVHNPFVSPGRFPLICTSGRDISSGPLRVDQGGRLAQAIKEQRFYKFSVTVLGTKITLD